MHDKRIVLMVRMDVPSDIEAEWNDWYDNEHIPNRVHHIPGFLSARRFVVFEDQPKYLTLYDLESVDVLTSEAYLALREREAAFPPDRFEVITQKLPNFSRFIWEQIYPVEGNYQIPDTEILFVVGHDVPAGREEAFHAWYNTEHIPAMLDVPGFITARRLITGARQLPSNTGIRSPGPTYLTLYDLESPDVLQSEIFIRNTNSPWSSWVRSWYSRRWRFLARRIFPKP